MYQTWLIYVLIAGLCSVIFNFLNRYLLRSGRDATTFGWWYEVLRTLIFLPFFFLYLPELNLFSILLFLLLGVSEIFSIYFYMRMHSFSELSTSTIVSQLRVIWLPLFAFVFLGEKLGIDKYFGVGLIFLGQLATTLNKELNFEKGIKYALLSSIFVATNSVIAKAAVPIFEPAVIIVAMGLPSIIAFPILMKEGKRRLKSFNIKLLGKILVSVLFSSLAMLFLLLALKTGAVSTVMSVFQATTVVSVFVGILFLGERKNIVKKLLGCGIVLMGAFLLI